MTKTSLNKSSQAEKSETETVIEAPVVDEASLAEIEGENLPATVATGGVVVGAVSGDFSSRDLIIPRLEAVQNVGDLSGIFEGQGGALILNKESLLVSAGESVSVTVVSAMKTWEENLPYDPNGPRPTVYHTREELTAAGMWDDWRDNQPPPVREVGTFVLLIEKPEGIECGAFAHAYKGKTYAPAQWTVRKTAYSRGAKPVFTAASTSLATKGLVYGKWALNYYRDKINGNYTYVPSMKMLGVHDDEFVAFVSSAFGN